MESEKQELRKAFRGRRLWKGSYLPLGRPTLGHTFLFRTFCLEHQFHRTYMVRDLPSDQRLEILFPGSFDLRLHRHTRATKTTFVSAYLFCHIADHSEVWESLKETKRAYVTSPVLDYDGCSLSFLFLWMVYRTHTTLLAIQLKFPRKAYVAVMQFITWVLQLDVPRHK
jgi:hypothetical protein